MYPLFAGAMVLFGALTMLVAVYRTGLVLRRLEQTSVRSWWVLLLSLMVCFVWGYLGFLVLVAFGIDRLLLILCGSVFLGGALFVLLVVSAADRTIVELQETRRELDAAVLASSQKSTFLANMSHELRTPLNAIIGYSEMMEEELGDLGQETLVEDAVRIRRAGDHLLRLIDDILDLAKIEAGRLQIVTEPVDVDAMLREIEGTIRPVAERSGNALVLDLSGPIGSVSSDGLRLKQCLLNLLSNACKFTANGQIRLAAERGSELLIFTVEDTGIGMSEDEIERVFEAFQQADPSTTRRYGGTGLGLTLTRQLATRLGGGIEVDSEPGVGSTFSLAIPTARIETPAPARSLGVTV